MFLVDTNIVSELRRQRPHKAVLAWIDSIDRRMLFISAVSIGEIQAGIEITRRQDLAKAAEIEAWLEMIEGSWQILGMDGSSFRHWARLMHGQSEALYEDGMIAATAWVHGLTIATRNIADFLPFKVTVYNPFKYHA